MNNSQENFPIYQSLDSDYPPRTFENELAISKAIILLDKYCLYKQIYGRDMTDYEKDMASYKFDCQYATPNDQPKEPDLKDYDENGYKKGSVKYEGNIVLDPYLIQVYGIEYARNHPLKKV